MVQVDNQLEVNGPVLKNSISMEEKERIWEHAWTTDEIRNNSGSWTLAGDVGILKHLEAFSHQLISKTHEMEKVVDSLVHQSQETCAKVNNVINDFQMLSNLQFVENRVYDEEVQDVQEDVKKEPPQKTKEQREAEMVPIVKQALQLGLLVLDTAFEKMELDGTSDSEEEEDEHSQGRTIFEPKDLYEHRPLPFVIGSDQFLNDDYAGLRYLNEEEVSQEISTQDENVSLSLGSDEESSEEEDIHDIKQVPPKDISTPQFQGPVRNTISNRSSSGSSDLFEAENEENGYSSPLEDDAFKPDKENKMVNPLLEELVSKTKKVEHPPLKVAQEDTPAPKSIPTKVSVKKESDDLFSTNDGFLDDDYGDDSPFRKKTGLFASDGIFGDEDKYSSGGLFEESVEVPKPKQKEKEKEKKTSISKNTNNNIFGDEDDDEESDLFASLSIPKAPTQTPQVSKPMQKDTKIKNAKQESSPISSTPVKKTKENGSDSLFGNDSDDDLFGSNERKKTFDFGSGSVDDDDDLFGNATPQKKATEAPKPKVEPAKSTKSKVPTLFNDDSDSFDLFNSSSPPESKDSLFDSISDKDSKTAQSAKEKTVSPLFDDSGDSFDLFSPVEKSPKSKHEVKLQTEKHVQKEVPKQNIAPVEPPPKQTKNIEVVRAKEVPKLSLEPQIQPFSSLEKVSPISDNVEGTDSQPISFDQPVESSKTLSALNKDRAKIQIKRRKPTRKGRQALQSSDTDQSNEPENIEKEVNINIPKESVPDDLFSSPEPVIEKAAEPVKLPTTHQKKEQQKKNLMSQLIAEAAASKVLKKRTILDSDESDDDLFSSKPGKSRTGSSKFSFSPPTKLKPDEILVKASDDITDSKQDDIFGSHTMFPPSRLVVKESIDVDIPKEPPPAPLLSDSSSDDDLFSSPSFKDFQSNVVERKSVSSLLDDDDDDDIFKAPKVKDTTSRTSGDIFDDDDIFAGMEKEKYEMFPHQEINDGDDIFEVVDSSNKSTIPGNDQQKSSKHKIEKKPVDIFEDPLGGLTFND